MAVSACYITTDLARLELFSGDSAQQWSPPDLGDAESDSAAAYRQRAQAAAQWVSQQGGAAKRLSIVCVDSSEALCTWVHARSTSHQVVASAYRDQTQEWGAEVGAVAVEPVLSANHESNARRSKKSGSGDQPDADEQLAPGTPGGARVCTPVITLHDALLRLWLDALDQRGVRPGAVISQWHAMAMAWGGDRDEITAVITISLDGTLLWCWSHRGELVTAGTITAPQLAAMREQGDEEEPTDPAADIEHRLSLDWLSWGAHTGVFPSAVKIVSVRESSLGDILKERFEGLRVEREHSSDPLRDTLERASRSMAASNDPTTSTRRCLIRLTNRPSRALRRRYRLSAAALMLAAVAFIGMGVRYQRATSSARPIVDAYREDVSSFLSQVPSDELRNSRRPISVLRALINEEQNRPAPPPPPSPPPIFAELDRITETIQKFDGVELATVQFGATGRSNQLRVDVEDRRLQLNFEQALKETGTTIEWSRTTAGGNRSLTLNGAWKLGGS